MDFTELYQQSNALVAFSSGAHWVANVVSDRLVVRRADTFQITRSWRVDLTPSATTSSFANASTTSSNKQSTSVTQLSTGPADSLLSHLSWSADSEFILVASARHGVVTVYKMRDEDWLARIEAGVEGLAKAEWSPDGRHVLCFSEWGVCRNSLRMQLLIHPLTVYLFSFV